jgi:hypothetical protein
MKNTVITLVIFLSAFHISAKEGMWIPLLLEKYNFSDMQQMGFKLSPQDIYDANHSSMKDAVVIFGRGCTGEIISNEGLLITNHHCGYSQIQSHSSVDHDYLSNGFWAMDKSEELANNGLTVSFLEYMEDVTEKIVQGTDELEGEAKSNKIKENTDKVNRDASESGKYKTSVKPLFYGNQYFLYVYKVYKDIRLVGAPPSAIGKFGGDTDNWMWPRHTGDFSIFRIYADKNNEPAEYSEDNVPFQPKKFFPVSMKGVQEGDFTMVFGNPGSTTQYWPHQAVDVTMNQRNPDRIALRDKKLEIIGADMNADPKVRIQYAAKYAGISNAWKKWQGESKGLKRLDAVNVKLEFENEFKNWAEQNGSWEGTYKPVFENFETQYTTYAKYVKTSDYYSEVVFRGVEIFRNARLINTIVNNIENKQKEKVESLRSAALNGLSSFFKDYQQSTDEKLFAALLPMLVDGLSPEFLPEDLVEMVNKYDAEKLLDKVFRKSILADEMKMRKVLESASDKQLLKLRKDPVVALFNQLNFKYEAEISPVVAKVSDEITEGMKVYMAGLMEMKQGQAFYPDANLTLRVAYGKVEGYEPNDGVEYKYYTSLSGIMEKDNPEIYDYDVPARLKELYAAKDFGRYEVNGDVPVCFSASNHTTGGNSGSPVVNGNGELIGVNFDRCWEGTMSDIMFDPERCRNISIDIRYALFLIDKFAGAGYLLDEMEIVE